LSQWNPIESLESRTLMASVAEMQFPPDWPAAANQPGVWRFGRTVYVKGTPIADSIAITTSTRTVTGLDFPANLLVEFRVARVTATVLYTGRIRRVLIDTGDGADIVSISATLPRTFHPEKVVIRGGAGDDDLTGSTRRNVILGEEGNDRLVGRNAADILIGGNGNDTITGAGGSDRFYGGAGDDRFINAETSAEQPSGTRDILDGGVGGNDTAQADPGDQRRNIENNNAV
jgi:Ca2+-binding RTX toxin-like protein